MADAFGLLRRVARDGEAAVFLDGVPEAAVTPADREVRERSLVAARPAASYCHQDGQAWLREGDGAWRRVPGEPFALLRSFARGGMTLGFASYDAGRLVERLPSRAADDARLPDLLFFRFDAWWDVPPEGDARPVGDDAELAERARREPAPFAPDSGARAPLRPRTTQKEFEDMVLRAQEAIRAGEVFQVNLSHRLETTTRLHPLALYARLREANPAPFGGYLASGPLPQGEPFHVLSSSPERLFRLRSRTLEARPIAGTRPRGATPGEDARLVEELRASAKERAEHVMLVDLARNDLGRVARYGTVRVPRLLAVESYRTVHHLVSVVGAELDEGKDAVDALVALFPGGTITGAPKVRAMEVIEDLEPVRRGAYTGSLGWMSPGGDADFNILIRTLVLREGAVHLQVGAGIVEESEPAKEYEETLAKAKGLLRALGERV